MHTVAAFIRKYKARLGLNFEAFFIPAVVVLVGLTAFGLGRLSALGVQGDEPAAAAVASYQAAEQPAPIAPAQAAPAQVGESSGKYVASKSGTKYYLPSCAGVSRIKEENKVWFATAAEAQAAGYGPAANCPGL